MPLPVDMTNVIFMWPQGYEYCRIIMALVYGYAKL